MKLIHCLPRLPFAGLSVPIVFDEIHLRHTERHRYWSLTGTRRKLIASFWLETISCHFIPVWIYGAPFVLLFSSASLSFTLPVMFLAGAIIYLFLLPTLYLPVFQIDFLPALDSYIEYRKNELISSIQKCKKEQYPVLTLMLIQYVYEKSAGITCRGINEHSIQLLVKQYGISSKSVDGCMRVILLKQWERSKERKRTEISDAFEKAKDHFHALQFSPAVVMLEELQQKVTG